MDAFIFVMGLTLAAVGVFLFRDYVRFLAGSYSISGKVVSIQQVFIPKPIGRKVDIEPYVADGFYPVVEYKSDSTPIRFTAIDNVASGRFHVGDKAPTEGYQVPPQASASLSKHVHLDVLIGVASVAYVCFCNDDGLPLVGDQDH